MANNRLYLRNLNTNKIFLLAKSLGEGWYVSDVGGLGARLQKYLDEQEQDAFLMDPASLGMGEGHTCYIVQDENTMETK